MWNVEKFHWNKVRWIDMQNVFKVDNNKHTRKISVFVILAPFSSHRCSICIVGLKLAIASYFASRFSLNIFQNSSDNCSFFEWFLRYFDWFSCFFSALLENVMFQWVNLAVKQALPVNIYLFKVNNIKMRKRCEICSKLIKETLERCHWHRSSVFIVDFKQHISQLFYYLYFLLILSK